MRRRRVTLAGGFGGAARSAVAGRGAAGAEARGRALLGSRTCCEARTAGSDCENATRDAKARSPISESRRRGPLQSMPDPVTALSAGSPRHSAISLTKLGSASSEKR